MTDIHAFGVTDALRSAVLAAYMAGAKDWALANYPQWADWLAEAEAEQAGVPPIVELNEGHWIEALHIAHVVSDLFEREVVEHPAVRLTPRLAEKARAVADALADFYEAVGAEAMETVP